MKNMLKVSFAVLYILYLAGHVSLSFANPDTVTFHSPAVWRADGEGDYVFKGNGLLKGAAIAKDGAVEYASSPGTYELTTPCIAEDLVLGLVLNWKFTGKVKMEVSVSDIPDNYIPVVNGVPIEIKTNFGTKIKWRATLSPKSRLTEARLSYTDMTGVAGTWGNPKLTGFGFRKPIVMQGTGIELFNHQVRVKIGESAKAKDCGAYLKGVLESDFADVAFTQADGETLIPFYREEVSGKKTDREAVFWLKIPQLPVAGLPLYIYYGRPAGEDLSSGENTFEFFDDFGSSFDKAKWEKYEFKEGALEYKDEKNGKIKTLDMKATKKEDIVKFFQVAKDYAWARVRKVSESQSVKVSEGQTGEEAPNLAAFIGTTVAPNGDLGLEEGFTSGEYYSPIINAPFKTRIMVPAWEIASAAQGGLAMTSLRGASGASDEAISISISADNGGTYKKDCESGKYYYASKKDFVEGGALRWKAGFSSPANRPTGQPANRLTKFTLDFRPGVITIMAPAGSEKILMNEAYNIRWSAAEYELSYPLTLEYSVDNGKAYKTIIENSVNDGTQTWLTPPAPSEKALIKIIDGFDPKIYAKSHEPFSIVAAKEKLGAKKEAAPTEEELALEKAVEEEARSLEEMEKPKGRGDAKLYELLIKRGSTPVSAEDVKQGRTGGAYQDGDVVMIKPAGYIWGASERSNFNIVQAYLTDQELKDLTSPEETTKTDKDGRPVKEMSKRRKYKIDLTKQVILNDAAAKNAGFSKRLPAIGKAAIVDKKAGE